MCLLYTTTNSLDQQNTLKTATKSVCFVIEGVDDSLHVNKSFSFFDSVKCVIIRIQLVVDKVIHTYRVKINGTIKNRTPIQLSMYN